MIKDSHPLNEPQTERIQTNMKTIYNLQLHNLKTRRKSNVTLAEALETMRREPGTEEPGYLLAIIQNDGVLGTIKKSGAEISLVYWTSQTALPAWIYRKIKGIKLAGDFTGRDFICKTLTNN